MQKPPVNVNQNHYNLVQQAQASPKSISFKNVGLESHKYLTLFETQPNGTNKYIKVNLNTK